MFSVAHEVRRSRVPTIINLLSESITRAQAGEAPFVARVALEPGGKQALVVVRPAYRKSSTQARDKGCYRAAGEPKPLTPVRHLLLTGGVGQCGSENKTGGSPSSFL